MRARVGTCLGSTFLILVALTSGIAPARASRSQAVIPALTCGGTWTIVPSPNLGTADILYGVSAASTDDVWAVGSSGRLTLVEHLDGTQWKIMHSPSPGTGPNALFDV